VYNVGASSSLTAPIHVTTPPGSFAMGAPPLTPTLTFAFTVPNNQPPVSVTGTVAMGDHSMLQTTSIAGGSLAVGQRIDGADFTPGTFITELTLVTAPDIYDVRISDPTTASEGAPVAFLALTYLNACSATNFVISATPPSSTATDVLDRCGRAPDLLVSPLSTPVIEAFTAYTQPALLYCVITAPSTNILDPLQSATFALHFTERVHLALTPAPPNPQPTLSFDLPPTYSFTLDNGNYDDGASSVITYTFLNNTGTPLNLAAIHGATLADGALLVTDCGDAGEVYIPPLIPTRLDTTSPSVIVTLDSLTLSAPGSRLESGDVVTLSALFSGDIFKATPSSIVTVSFILNGGTFAIATLSSIVGATATFSWTNATGHPRNLCTASNFTFSTNLVDSCDEPVLIVYPVTPVRDFPFTPTLMTGLTVSANANVIPLGARVTFTVEYDDDAVSGSQTVAMVLENVVVADVSTASNSMIVRSGIRHLAAGVTLECVALPPLTVALGVFPSSPSADDGVVVLSNTPLVSASLIDVSVLFISAPAVFSATDSSTAIFTMNIPYSLNLCAVSEYRVSASNVRDLCDQLVQFPPSYALTLAFPIVPTVPYRCVLVASDRTLDVGESLTASVEFTVNLAPAAPPLPSMTLTFNAFATSTYEIAAHRLLFSYTNSGPDAIDLCTLTPPVLTPLSPDIFDECGARILIVNPIALINDFADPSSVTATSYTVSALSSLIQTGETITFITALNGHAQRVSSALPISLSFTLQGVTYILQNGTMGVGGTSVQFLYTNSGATTLNLCALTAVRMFPNNVVDDCGEEIVVPDGLPIVDAYPVEAPLLQSVTLSASSGSASFATFIAYFSAPVVGTASLAVHIAPRHFDIPGSNATLSDTMTFLLNSGPSTPVDLCLTVIEAFNAGSVADECGTAPEVPDPIPLTNPFQHATYLSFTIDALARLLRPGESAFYNLNFDSNIFLTPSRAVTLSGVINGAPFTLNADVPSSDGTPHVAFERNERF
jgi:hypothetical protein